MYTSSRKGSHLHSFSFLASDSNEQRESGSWGNQSFPILELLEAAFLLLREDSVRWTTTSHLIPTPLLHSWMFLTPRFCCLLFRSFHCHSSKWIKERWDGMKNLYGRVTSLSFRFSSFRTVYCSVLCSVLLCIRKTSRPVYCVFASQKNSPIWR